MRKFVQYRIMLKCNPTILLIALMCISSTSGAFTAICHGSDGHIAVEPLVHNHCACSKASQADSHEFAGGSIVSVDDHGHCKDSIATSSYIFSTRKNVKTSIHKAFSANLFLNSAPTHSRSLSGYLAAESNELSSFYTPLRTVILLA